MGSHQRAASSAADDADERGSLQRTRGRVVAIDSVLSSSRFVVEVKSQSRHPPSERYAVIRASGHEVGAFLSDVGESV